MRVKFLLVLAAVAVAVVGQGASTRADDEVQFTDIDVRLAAHEQRTANSGTIHAAFLSDNAVPQSQAQLVSYRMAHRGLNSGRGDQCPECAMGDAWRIGPDSNCGMACDCGTPSCGCETDRCESSSSCQSCDSCSSCGCDSGCSCDDDSAYLCGSNDIRRRMIYGDVEVMWLRAHVMEDAVGKLSEQYKFSPRLVAGYEDPCGVGARVRYWHYDHTTETLGSDTFLNFGFDVLDAELTSRFSVRRTDLVVSGGARWASIDVGLNDEFVGSTMLGLTVSADVRTELCGGCGKRWSGIAGARWSTLGGDWEGSNQGFVPEIRDDNIVVQELYAGVEYSCCTSRGHNLFARLTFELQNWHSDAASQFAGTDSIGFVGPGIHVGGSF